MGALPATGGPHHLMNESQRHAYREFIRTHHPDIGGDPEVFAAGLAEFREGSVSGSFTARWPEWVSPDDRRLKADIVFHRKPRGFEAIFVRLKQLCSRDKRPVRVR